MLVVQARLPCVCIYWLGWLDLAEQPDQLSLEFLQHKQMTVDHRCHRMMRQWTLRPRPLGCWLKNNGEQVLSSEVLGMSTNNIVRIWVDFVSQLDIWQQHWAD